MAKASPHQIAMYGHIATLIREYLKKEGIGVAEMNSRLGIARTSTVLYGLRNATFAPNDDMRERLMKLLNVPESELKARNTTKEAIIKTVTEHKQSASRDILQFSVDGDGNATIKLNVTMPVQTAMPLLRMLLDAGVVFDKEIDNA